MDFPRYDSKKALTTDRPEPLRDEAAAQGKLVTQALDVASDIAVKVDKAMITSQGNALAAQKGLIVADVKSRAVNEVDQNAMDKYIKELDDFEKNATKGMTTRAKMVYSGALQNDIALAKIQVQGVFQKKIITQAGKNLVVAMDGYKNDVLSTSNPAEMSYKIDQAFNQIEQNVADGIINADSGKAMKDEFVEDIRVGAIDRDLYSNPEQFKENEKKGQYKFKDEKERSEKLSKADTLLKSQENFAKWQEKQIYTDGAYQASQGLINKSLTPEGVREMYRKGDLDSETAAIFDEVLTTGDYQLPEGTTLAKPDFFLRLLEDAGDNKTEALSIMKQAVRAYGKKEMGSNQFGYFITMANEKFNAQKEDDVTWGAMLKEGVKQMREFSKRMPVPVQSNLVNGFMTALQEGATPDVAAQNVMRGYIKTLPGVSLLPDSGGIFEDANGNRARIKPSGQMEIVE